MACKCLTAERMSMKCLKHCALVYNAVFFLLGIGRITVGAWEEHAIAPFGQLTNLNQFTTTRLMMAIGVALIIILPLGCYGIVKEKRRILYVYSALLLVLLGLQITECTFEFQERYKIESIVEKDLEKNIKEYQNNTNVIDDLQSKLQCCGSAGPFDWKDNADYENSESVPDSCCKTAYYGQDCGRGQRTDRTKIYLIGCHSKLPSNRLLTVFLSLGTVAIQFVGVAYYLDMARNVGRGFTHVVCW